MKDIKVFLASTLKEPIKQERNAIGNFIRILNDCFHSEDKDIYIDLFVCELESVAVATEQRKQSEYNKIIEGCDLFINLYYDNVGGFTKEELSVAIEKKRELLIFFCKAPDPNASVTELRAELKEKNIPFVTYNEIKEVKLALLEWLEKKEVLTTEHRDGIVFSGDQPLLRI